MSRPIDPDVHKRNEKICEEWMEGNKTAKVLSREYGVGEGTIRSITRTSGCRAADRKKPPIKIPRVDYPPISTLHRKLGGTISYSRIMDLGFTKKRFAKRAGMSRNRLSEIEAGVYDPTISELTRICSVIGIPIADLVRYSD